jgi:thyrotropin-releasing hormone receptor
VFRSSEALQARKGVVKMLIVSVVVYFISYSPKQILLIYDTVHPSDFHENWTVHVFTMIVCYINSAANPVLYSIFSQNFRKNFKVGDTETAPDNLRKFCFSPTHACMHTDSS